MPLIIGGMECACLADPTSHGSPLAPGPGALTVLYNGRPIWRVGVDFHACPIVKGVVPDVGGLVVVGALTTLIMGAPAARKGDIVVEIPGGPNPIIPGAFGGGGGGSAGSGAGPAEVDASEGFSWEDDLLLGAAVVGVGALAVLAAPEILGAAAIVEGAEAIGAAVEGAEALGAATEGAEAAEAAEAASAAEGGEGAAAESAESEAATEPEPSVGPDIPDEATQTFDTVKETGQPPDGFKGGGKFANDGRGGGEALPQTAEDGSSIGYKEYDVNPYQKGVDRGPERVVVGTDGAGNTEGYYTADHYQTFTKMP